VGQSCLGDQLHNFSLEDEEADICFACISFLSKALGHFSDLGKIRLSVVLGIISLPVGS
jgi:hypothetical protein